MDLLDRYLATIRHNLPPARAADITEELRDELLDRIEAREQALGRPLEEPELSAIIREAGHPLVVAGRYREHQYLIGPATFPFYVYALRVVLVIALAVLVFSSLVPVLVSGGDAGQAALQGLGNAWNTLFTAFAIVTVLFAIFERQGFPKAHLANWRPEQMAQMSERKRGKWESPFEVGMGLLLLLIWTGIIPVPLAYEAGGVRLEPAPIWAPYYWPVLILAAARLIYNVIDWLRPDWKTARFVLGGGTIVGGIALLGRLAMEKAYVVATPIGAGAAEAPDMAIGINTALHIAITVSIIVWSVGLIMLIYRLGLRRLFAR